MIDSQLHVVEELRARLREAEETLDAIRHGEVDAVVVKQAGSSKIFTLESADRPYRSLIEQMKEGAVAMSGDGLVLYANRRLGEILAAPVEQVVGSNIRRFFEGEELEKLDMLLRSTGPAPSRAELCLSRQDARPVAVYISICEIVSDAGAPRVIGGVITDLTEQHEIDARSTQARKMEAVGQLTGGLAHDFNNLFQAVCGNLSLIKACPGDTAGVAKWADSGLKAADRGRKLTAQLLAFSRQQQIAVQPVDVGELLAAMADALRDTLGDGIAIEYALCTPGIWALANRTQLEQAILNLSINARDAMPHGGRLRISTKLRDIRGDPELQPGSYLELDIADTGSGMSDIVRDRAFDPFFTTKKVGEGTGMGLAQVYGIARQAGGAARIFSSVDKGTTVALLLRQSVAAQAPAGYDTALRQLVASAAGRPRTKVLVIDDDDDVRSVLVESLAMSGYDVSDAASGLAGLEKMAACLPDLLLIDFLMPKMNGAEVVKRARERGFGMPVIFATGYANTRALDAAVGLKATVLAKPFTLPALLAAVEAALPTTECIAAA